jgi:hypothetical protein
MGLLQTLYPAEPVRQAIARLDELRPLFEGDGAHLGRLAFSDVRKTIRTAFLNDPDDVRRMTQNPYYNPRIACLRAIATVARHDLISGPEHLFYDRLAMLGDGKRTVYSIASAELVKEGALTAEDRLRFCRQLDEDIREAG